MPILPTADGEVWRVVEGEGGDDRRREGGSDDGVASEATRDAFEEIDFGREFQDYLDPGYKTQEIEYKEDAPTFEQFLTRPPSLADHLEWQLHMSPIEERRLRCGDLCHRQSECRRPSERDERRDRGDGTVVRRCGRAGSPGSDASRSCRLRRARR